MELKYFSVCGLLLLFGVLASHAELIGYPHAGCYSDWKIQRDIEDDYSVVSMRGKEAIATCFSWAKRKGFKMFAISDKKCHSGSNIHMRYKDYRQSEACSADGTGGRGAYDFYFVRIGASCQDLPEGAYQDRFLCNRYVNCTGDKTIIGFCSKGLLFNPASLKCEKGVPCNDGQPCLYVPKDGKYEHPSSCRKYLYCKDKQAMEVPCSGDLWFNTKTAKCDVPKNVDCPHDPCVDTNCRNGGTCEPSSQSENKYKCICTDDYMGMHCEKKVPHPCKSGPCENGASCTELGGEVFKCTCKAGFAGKLCEKDLCKLRPCQNGGSCYGSLHDPRGYTCACKTDYTGAHCEKEIPHPCRARPCKNNAVCTELGGERFRCTCKPGYTGRLCETDVCARNPCLNSGTCVHAYRGYTCKCTADFTGSHCEKEIPHPCRDDPCQNGGTCTEHGGNRFSCKCKPEYTGKLCENKKPKDSTIRAQSVILMHDDDASDNLMKFIGPVEDAQKSWKRCYRGSDFDFSSTAFHMHCHSKGPTVVVVKAGGFVFGGYTDKDWAGWKSTYAYSKDSFLFSLQNPMGQPAKMPAYRYYDRAIYSNYNYGPTFGFGPDLMISNQCNRNTGSRSRLGYTYRKPSAGYQIDSILPLKVHSYSYEFKVDEYEVFYQE